MASDRYPLRLKVSSFSGKLVGQKVCLIFVEELVRSVLNKRRHLSSVGVSINDNGSAPYVRWENHDGLVLFQAFKCHCISFVMLGSGGSAC